MTTEKASARRFERTTTMKRLIASFASGLILQSYASLVAAQSLTTAVIARTAVDQSGAVMASVLQWGM